jgi:PAS domain S-box-containing protein
VIDRGELRRSQAVKALQILNRDFLTLLESTTDFIYFKDKDSRIRFCSQTMARITGHSSWREMVGKHDLEIFPEETARIYYEEELPLFRDGVAILNRIDPYFDEQGQQGWVSTNKCRYSLMTARLWSGSVSAAISPTISVRSWRCGKVNNASGICSTSILRSCC